MQGSFSLRRIDRFSALLGVVVLLLVFWVWRIDGREASVAASARTPSQDPLAGGSPPGPPTLDPALESPDDPIWRQSWVAIDNPDRDQNPTTGLVLDWVAPRPDMVIADIGAGGGYFAARFAPRVAPGGRVLAVDADPRMVRKMAYERAARRLQNVVPIGVVYGNLGLAPASIDTITFIEVGAFLTCARSRNREYIQQAAAALRPGGRLFVLNEDSERQLHREGDATCAILPAEALIETAQADFTLVRQQGVALPNGWRGYALLFQKR